MFREKKPCARSGVADRAQLGQASSEKVLTNTRPHPSCCDPLNLEASVRSRDTGAGDARIATSLKPD